MQEIWKVIFVDYFVSNLGRVKSLKGGKEKFLTQHLTKDGYFYVQLRVGNKGKNFRVHRLVALAFIPNPDNKPQVNHKDGNKLNNCIENLEWVTSTENQIHAVVIGLRKSGEKNFRAKLTNEQVEYIRSNPKGLSACELAEKFSVSRRTIGMIQLGQSYKNAGGAIRGRKQSGRPPIFSNEQKSEIKRRHKVYGVNQRILAEEFGCSRRTINSIVCGK